MRRAFPLPLLTKAVSLFRSSVVKVTLYFFAGISTFLFLRKNATLRFVRQSLFVKLLGCVDISSQPDECPSEGQKSEMMLVQFFKARKETSVMLDFVEEALDQMSLLVQMFVVRSLFLAVFSRRYHRFGLFLSNLLQKGVRIIGTVGDRTLKLVVCNQIFRLGEVMPLAARQKKAQRIAQGVYARMDFGAEPTSAAPERLGSLASFFWEAPAAPGWARTTVQSSMIFSISGSSTKC